MAALLAISTSLQHRKSIAASSYRRYMVILKIATVRTLDRLSRPFSAPTVWQTRGTVAAFESN
jgi:hypothetical protein